MYHEAAKISGERFCAFYPFRNSFFSQPLGPARVLQKLRLHFKNCGSCIWNDDEQPRCFGKANSQMQEPQFLKWSRNFWKTPHPTKKRSPWPPKKVKMRSPKKVFPRIHYGMYILQKTRSNLVYFGLWSLISDLPPPIGGPHPVLYFPSQIQRNIVQRCARGGGQTHSIAFEWFPIIYNL